MDYETEIGNLKNEMGKLNSEFSNYKLETQKIIESYNEQFNTLFIDYDLKTKGIVKCFQDLSCELLSFFDKICEKHDLAYWIDYGTLLGAQRHGTFIPWDDDLDVGMMAKDFIQFSKIINQEIKEHNLEENIHFFPYKETRKDFFMPFHKLEFTTDEGEILTYMDIFPYDYSNSKKITESEYINEGINFLIFLSKHEPVGDFISEYYEKYDLNLDDGEYIIPGLYSPRTVGHENKLYFWKKEEMEPFGKINFYGKPFPCPKNVEYYLTTTYRSYDKIPLIIFNHEFLKDLRKTPHICEIYEHYIDKIKHLNK